MNQLLIVTVRREERGAGNVRQRIPGGRRDQRQRIHSLWTVGVAVEVCASVIEGRTLLQVDRPVGGGDRRAGDFGVFDRVLIDGRVDQTKIINDTARLRALTGPEESWHGDGGQQRDDRNHDHDFHEGEAPAILIEFT